MSKRLKAFVRYDGSGRVISSSLILAANKPKVGNWKEVNAYECCNVNSNCVIFTTTIAPGGENLAIRIYPAVPLTVLLGTVNWGDGTITDFSEFFDGQTNHTYTEGNYTGTICFDNPLEVGTFNIDGND
jgi:hypothetical protein